MKIRLLYIPGLLAIAGFWIACSKEAYKKPGAENLTGRWTWVRTDGGLANLIHDTPASTGQNVEVELTDGRKFYLYTNGALTAQGSFQLERRTCIHDHTEKTFLNFPADTLPDMMVEQADGGTLQLSDEAYDGLTYMYKKKESKNN